MTRPRRALAVGLTATLALLAACGADEGSSPAPPTVPAPTSTSTTASPSATTRPGATTSAPGVTTTSVAPRPLADLRIRLTKVAEVEQPVAMALRTGDPVDVTYVASRTGAVHRLTAGRVDPEPVLDVSGDTTPGGERGLLGLAFGPDGTHVYVNFTDHRGDTQVQEFAWVGGASGRADPATRRTVLTQDQPYPNHNGGNLVFGPDGMLYIGFGDGGSGGDPQRRASNPQVWLGKLLRIDPTGGDPYAVPADNPFVGKAGVRPEIWATGLRNPWRYSFDAANGDLWLADVGQSEVEEIDHLPFAQAGGADYGWSAFEGTNPYNGDVDATGTVVPVSEYEHGVRGCSVTGGYVYRGHDVPGLAGAYLYADYCAPGIWGLRLGPDGAKAEEAELTTQGQNVASFGQDARGELYVLSIDSGIVSRVDAG